MGLPQGQQKILDEIADVVRQQKALKDKRDALILKAVEAKIPRVRIAETAELSEPMIYKIRRDELEKRDSGLAE
ncbi:hypothetical protein [Nocardia miyunensis]|uniref:hypothetical protein n=1 Tax=Nocardia miyunensis TaxID=282684 RepID=UPI00082AF7AF|nr:hypothetical protein [Nocardia miyunensis]